MKKKIGLICYLLSYISVTMTFVIEYYELIPAPVWSKYLLRVGRWIPFFYIAIAPTTLLGVLLNLIGFILIYKKR